MRFLKYFTITLLVYLIISLSIARFIVFYTDNNISIFQTLIDKANLNSLTVTNVDTNWKGIYPYIKLNITNNKENQNIKFPRTLELHLNIYKTIVYFKPVIKSLYLENITYTGSISDLEGVINKNSKKILIENILISESNFNFQHNNKLYKLNKANILIKKNSIKISSNIDKDKKLNVKISNILINSNNMLQKIDYKINISGKFNYEFSKIFETKNIEIKDSELLLELHGKYKNGYFEKNLLSVKTLSTSNFYVHENIIKNLNFKAILSGDIKNKINFEVTDYSSKSKNNYLYEFKNISGSYDHKNKTFSLYANNIHINTEELFEDYNFLKINDFKFVGSAEKLKIKFSRKKNLNNFFLEGNFNNSSIQYKENYINNFTGFINFKDNTASVELNSKDIEIYNNSILNKKLKFDFVSGKLSVIDFSNPNISFDKILLSNNHIKFIVSGNINKALDSVNVFSHLKYIDMKYITNYLPKNFMSEKTSNYFSSAFRKGETKNGYISISGSLSDYPFYDDFSGISFAIFPITNLAVDYKKGWIPFENINGKAYFVKRKAYFDSDDFKVLSTKVENSNLYIEDVKNTVLDISGDLNGPLNDLISYSNKAKLSNIKRNNIDKLSGNSNTSFKMSLAFNGNKNFYKSSIHLKNVNFKYDNNNKIKDINGIIKFKNNKFFTEENNYLEGFYNNEKIKFQLKTNNDKNFVISGTQEIQLNKYIKIKNINNIISGSSNWEYKIYFPGFNSKKNNIEIFAYSNLYGTSVKLPYPLNKSTDSNVKTKISLSFSQESFKNISISYNNIFSEIKNFNSLNGYVDFSGNKHKIPNKKLDLYGIISTLDLNKWNNFNNEESNVNYISYLNKINIKINKLSKDKVILNNFIVKGSSSDKGFYFDEITSFSDIVNINANGFIEDNNISSFKINLKSKNLQNLLNYWDVDHSLRNSTIDSNFDISWKGSLFDFSLKNVYGKFSANMKDGRIKKVGNRVTRIFGLFNIDLLAKRLSLDFDDVTKNGFYFNSLNGDFRIDNGNIFTTNLFIQGPSAELLAVGTTDIINETYDMHVIASPEFGETLPAIALIGGPITAAATFAAEKLAKAFGKDINDLIKIKYKVSGSWDNPEVKIENKKVDVLDNVQELFE